MKVKKNSGYWITAWREVLRRPRGLISLAVVILYLAVAVWGYSGLFTPDWKTEDFQQAYRPPSRQHWFGTDIYGRDVFAKTIYGTRVAITVALIAAVLAWAIGLMLGLLAGYFGGWVDDVITWLYSTLQSIPYILLIGNKEEATAALKVANQQIHKFVSKGILKKNTAARKVSRLHKSVNAI